MRWCLFTSIIVVVDPDGCLILPDNVIGALGVAQGSKVVLVLEGKRATLSSLDETLRCFRGRWKVTGRSLVDEFIQERREEARREQEALEDTDVRS